MDSGDGNSLQNQSTDEKDAFGKSNGFIAESVAKMTVAKKAPYYKMDHPRRGTAIIFNHENFTMSDLKTRSGTQQDCVNFHERLLSLHFDVKVYHDLEYRDLKRIVEEAAAADHSESDCFLLCVMSHGDTGILYAKDTPYKPENLWLPFTADKSITLAGKPKMFFIQACQGSSLDRGVTLMTSRTETDGQPSFSYKIPACADFLIAYSTIPGYYSWRNTTKGSWFMQALCEELRENQFNHDILTLLTFVSQRVAMDFESNVPDNYSMHRQKQIPYVTTMLTRLIKFTPK